MWADFPPADAFASATTTTCSRDPNPPTLGPCLLGVDGHRQDISEGELGVPVVFAFKVVDSSCNPMPGITVELWHTNCQGYYSGDENAATYKGPNWNFGNICLGNNTDRINEARSSLWHRGSQITDSEGVVYFKSCFPGWYTGRLTHAHIKFSENNQELFHTQFFWSDELCEEIQVNHPEYIGQRQDITLAQGNDPEFGRNPTSDKRLEGIMLEDGSMLCSKIVTVA